MAGTAAFTDQGRQATSGDDDAHPGGVGDTPARLYGAVRWGSLERRRDALDQLIAAHAQALDVTLVTNNPRDFAP
ncbi:MAG: hypothetical protein ACKO8I_16490 [Cyanobacteriota bacterium]